MDEARFDSVVLGAGPAGLAAARKLTDAGKKVLVIEADSMPGGICKTLEFEGCRFDIGGHRFFTKIPEVDRLWKETLRDDFLIRPRLSRIFYDRKFFKYPIKVPDALRNLGLMKSVSVIASYAKARLSPFRNPDTFDKWVTNHFGRRLYEMFFKEYSEKLWGMRCDEMSSEWVAQRIKGLSFFSAVKEALFPDRKNRPKTLIEEFRYPKHGPGMMYDRMAENLIASGAEIWYGARAKALSSVGGTVNEVFVEKKGGSVVSVAAEGFVSTVPLTELAKMLEADPSGGISSACSRLRYRSFVGVNLILAISNPFPDNWIYVHSGDVRMLRMQNMRNWSPHMVKEGCTALGLEYFCSEGDDLWKMADKDLIALGMADLGRMGFASEGDLMSGFAVRVAKAYPVYDGEYKERIGEIRDYVKGFSNLEAAGRGGMFRYNNMDHSILTGFRAAENILGAKHDLWGINADDEYCESGNAE